MKDLILITGATSGIGYEMAKLLASKKFDLVLVSRKMERLTAIKNELESNFRIAVHVFAQDLSQAGSANELFSSIEKEGLEVTMLINNAGVGMYGEFADIDLEQEINMINLNVTSLVAMTKLFLQNMILRKRGRILNVASLLSFLPFPYYATYSATKAFVLAFSETISAELEGSGVGVVTLCPGPVDTPFNTDAMWKTNAYRANPPMPAKEVAEKGVELLLNGKGKKIVGFNNWFISNLPRITPDKIMMQIKKKLASQVN